MTQSISSQFDYNKFSEDFIQSIRDGKPLLGTEGVLTPLLKSLIDRALDVEMNTHLENELTSTTGEKNRRNGKVTKTVKSSIGEIEIQTPRDRNSTFEPQLIKKRQTVLTKELDDKILSLFGCGMSYEDIIKNVKEIYGVDVSDSMIYNVTEQILPLLNEWRNRALENVYPIVFLDAMFFKVRTEGKVTTKVMYNIMGINIAGKKDILGFYTADSEGANFWSGVLSDLKNRGVQDILIACIDGLKGFPEAISSIFPMTEIQLCIVHQIRNSFKFVGSSHQKEFMRDLKTVYQSSNQDVAFQNLSFLDAKWGKKYPLAIKPWYHHWDKISCFFKFTPEIRKLIYTTNAIEGFHRQIRKYTKTKGAFTSENALLKLTFCAIMQIQKKWTSGIQNWALIVSQLDLQFNGRLNLN